MLVMPQLGPRTLPKAMKTSQSGVAVFCGIGDQWKFGFFKNAFPRALLKSTPRVKRQRQKPESYLVMAFQLKVFAIPRE